MSGEIPSAIDFHDPAQAESWVAGTVERRPWRPAFFAAFAAALNATFDRPCSVAELGSGPGHLAAAILQRCDIASYTAIDFSPAMHDLARAHLGDAAARVGFLTADFRDGDWCAAVAGVDSVVTMQAAHEVRHKSRLPALFARVYAAIRPGGVFLYCDHYAEAGRSRLADLYFSRSEQPLALSDAGFTDVALRHDEGGMALYSARRPDRHTEEALQSAR